MWSHLGEAASASASIWWDIWNCLRCVTQSFFSITVLRFFIGCSSHFVAVDCLCLRRHLFILSFWFCCFDPSMSQLFVFSSSFLSHHLFICICSAFLTIFFHYSMSFSYRCLSGKPRSQNSTDIHGNCKQVSPTLCRHELVLVLQLWKITDSNLVKQSNQQVRIYCTAYHHMFSSDALLNPNTVLWRQMLIPVINNPHNTFLSEKLSKNLQYMLKVGNYSP